MNYSIQQLADLAGVSVRTLHHYDDIGLLTPARETNGYRMYGEPELLRLQQILLYKELDLPLEDIKKMIDDPAFDLTVALSKHRKTIEAKRDRLTALIKTIDKTMKKIDKKAEMSDDELFDAFWDKHEKEYAAEAEQRWGHTDAYKQSMERTKHLTKEDHKRMAKEGDAFMRQLAALIDHDPKSEEVQRMIATHYESLRTFYEPSVEIYRGLAQMYVEDSRFRAYFERFHAKLPEFMRSAMNAYCDQLGGT